MGGKLRYFLAAGFVAVFLGIACVPPDHAHLALLQTRAWLLQGDDASPLAQVVARGGVTPPLRVDGVHEQIAPEYARLARDWARANGRAIGDGDPLRLEMQVDDAGLRATLSRFAQDRWQVVDVLERTRVHSPEDPGYYPDRWSLLPAVLAIVLALVTGRVALSLLAGCLAAALLAMRAVPAAGAHFLRATLWEQALIDDGGGRVVLLVLLFGMALAVMARSGGIEGLAAGLGKVIRGPVRSQLCGFAAALVLAIDDHASRLFAGKLARPLSEEHSVSREKLAFVVDATAGSACALSIASTWAGLHVGALGREMAELTPEGTPASDGLGLLLELLPYRFYCIFMLMLVVLTILMRRDFGGMLRAERRARDVGRTLREGGRPLLGKELVELRTESGAPPRARNAWIPLAAWALVALAVAGGLGWREARARGATGLAAALPGADALIAGVVAGALVMLVVAVALAVLQRALHLRQALRCAMLGAGSLLLPVVAMILAWTLGRAGFQLGTAAYLTAMLPRGLEPWMLPLAILVLSALVALATGSARVSMLVLLPSAVVLAQAMGVQDPSIGGSGLVLLTVGAVIEGALFGRHCSPIAPTTVLSSAAAACDHRDHVLTQVPYACLAMALALGCGYLPMVLLARDRWPLALGAAALVMVIWLLVVGRDPDREEPVTAAEAEI